MFASITAAASGTSHVSFDGTGRAIEAKTTINRANMKKGPMSGRANNRVVVATHNIGAFVHIPRPWLGRIRLLDPIPSLCDNGDTQ